jgi:hypothetical protein
MNNVHHNPLCPTPPLGVGTESNLPSGSASRRRPRVWLALAACVGVCLLATALSYGCAGVILLGRAKDDMAGLRVVFGGTALLCVPAALLVGFVCALICRGHFFMGRFALTNPYFLALPVIVAWVVGKGGLTDMVAHGGIFFLVVPPLLFAIFSTVGALLGNWTMGRRMARGFEPVM